MGITYQKHLPPFLRLSDFKLQRFCEKGITCFHVQVMKFLMRAIEERGFMAYCTKAYTSNLNSDSPPFRPVFHYAYQCYIHVIIVLYRANWSRRR